MASVNLPELGVTLSDYPYDEDTGNLYVVSTTDPLSMRKTFPLSLGSYTFTNRDQFISYVAHWLSGNEEKAREIAKTKKRPASAYVLPEEGPLSEWAKWAPSIAYVIAKANVENFREPLLAITLSNIGASGKDPIWELGQDKTTAARSAPPHAWGLNAWGKALTRLRSELLEVEQEKAEDDSDLAPFLASPLGEGTIADKLSRMTVGDDGLWSNEDVVTSFMVTFRRSLRTKSLDRLKQWVSESRVEFVDAWDFVSTLPILDRVRNVLERDAIATDAFLKSLSSVEKCKRCGSNVLVAEEQTRSADEPATTVIKCFNTDTCATKKYDRTTGKEFIEPRVYPYSVSRRVMLQN